MKGKQSCLMWLCDRILHAQSAANELQHHMPNMAARSLALFLSWCDAPGAALCQFQVQVLHVFVFVLTWCVTSIEVGLYRVHWWIYTLMSCQLALSQLAPRFIHAPWPCPGQRQGSSLRSPASSLLQRGWQSSCLANVKAPCWVCTGRPRDSAHF